MVVINSSLDKRHTEAPTLPSAAAGGGNERNYGIKQRILGFHIRAVIGFGYRLCGGKVSKL